MRALRWTLAAVALAFAPATSEAQIGVPVDDYDDYDDYGPAVAEYYGAPLERMPAWVEADELPIIYLLAREAGVSPRVIIALRERGWSWMDITWHLGVDPTLYVERLPYSTGYWRRYSSWELRYLSDRHVIDFVNLCFWADYHRRPIRQVIIIRQQVPSWRYYARYHAPPRSVPRGVYVRAPSRRPDSPRRDTPRYAVPRDESQRRSGGSDDRRAGDRRERSTQPQGAEPGSGQPQGVRRAGPGSEDRPRRTEERDVSPRRAEERDRSRPAAAPSRQASEPPRREAAPARTESRESRGSGARRSDGESRGGAAASARSQGSSRESSSSRGSSSGRRGN